MTLSEKLLLMAMFAGAGLGSLVLALTLGIGDDWATVGETGPSAGTGLPYILLAGAYAAFYRYRSRKRHQSTK